MTFDTLFKDTIDFTPTIIHTQNSGDSNKAEKILKVLEGRDIKSTLTREFPTVIAQLLGPSRNSDGDYYRLQMLVVPFKERQQGLATRYMKRLVELAKSEDKDIFLSPSAEYQEPGAMTKGQITQWYKTFGFEKKRKDDFRSQDTYCLYK